MDGPVLPLALSLGDPAGIGPELIAQAWAQHASAGLPPFFVVGGAGLLAEAAASRGLPIEIRRIGSPAEASATFASALPVLGDEDAPYTPGKPNPGGAQLALHSLGSAVHLASERLAGGIVTAPVAKAELAAAGFAFPGQTEFLAHACGLEAEDAVMMLAGPSLKAVPLTVHVPLAQVASLLSTGLIVHRARIVATALREDFGIAAPHLALCGLNPHAGESGRMGREDSEIIAPAIIQLRAEGIDSSGPHPADTMFAPHKRATYDVALAMYHDQALIPLKALDFDSGVNVTLGLPIVRTSPDHGTAFDIAGKSVADPGAMIASIRMAGEIVRNRARHA